MIKSALLIFFTLFVFSHAQAASKDQSILDKVDPKSVQARIAELRMGDLIVQTTPGEKVSIRQTDHEFRFGTAIPNQVAENAEEPITELERRKYLQLLKDNFNYAVHENALKWYDTEKEPGKVNYSVADRIWELTDALDIPMRGHCIYWAKDEFLMDWLKSLNNDQLRLAVKNRAQSLVTHYKGKIDEFDLNNEMLHGDFFRSRLGYGIISEMAWMVKSFNPDAKLYMNDYGIVDIGYNAGPYANQIEKLLANGVPIDGIGIQAHRTLNGKIDNTPYMVQKNLDRFNKFNLPLKITEALFVYDTDKERAEELKKLFPIYFAHSKVEAILMWGVWEKAHWIPHSAMWKSDFSETKQAKAYRDLVFDEWWTDTKTKADKEGNVSIRAFYGSYDIIVNGQKKSIKLEKSKGKVVVNF